MTSESRCRRIGKSSETETEISRSCDNFIRFSTKIPRRFHEEDDVEEKKREKKNVTLYNNSTNEWSDFWERGRPPLAQTISAVCGERGNEERRRDEGIWTVSRITAHGIPVRKNDRLRYVPLRHLMKSSAATRFSPHGCSFNRSRKSRPPRESSLRSR